MLKKLGKKFGNGDDVSNPAADNNNINTQQQSHNVIYNTNNNSNVINSNRISISNDINSASINSAKSKQPVNYVVNTNINNANNKTVVRTKSGMCIILYMDCS